MTIDFGTYYHGYCSDITRTVAVGKAKNPELYKISYLPENPGENLVFFPYPVGRRFKKVEKLKSDCKNKKLR